MTKNCPLMLGDQGSDELLGLLPRKHTSSDGPESGGGPRRRREGRRAVQAKLAKDVVVCLSIPSLPRATT